MSYGRPNATSRLYCISVCEHLCRSLNSRVTQVKGMSYFRKILTKYPLLTNCGVYGSLYFTAEFSQQTIIKKWMVKPGEGPQPYDKEALKRYGIVGTVVLAPTLFYWYRFLDGKIMGTAMRIVFRKCLIDQFLFTPNLLAMFYVSMSFLEGKPDLLADLKAKFVPTFVVSSCFWLPVQAVNFSVVPARYRVTYIGFASLLWANILCYCKRTIGNKEEDEPREGVKA